MARHAVARSIVYGVVFLFVTPGPTPAQNPQVVWVTDVSAEVTVGDGGSDEARARAWAALHAEALKRLNLTLRPELLLAQRTASAGPADRQRANDAFVNLLRFGSSGFVTDFRNIRWSPARGARDVTGSGGTTVRVRGDVKVVRSKGGPDPGLFVDVLFDQETYRVGDPVGVVITPSDDVYLSVYHIAGDSARVLYPTSLGEMDRVPAGQVLRLPRSLDEWVADVPEGWDETEDLLIVLAKRDSVGSSIGGGGSGRRHATLREALLFDILEELLAFPQSRRMFAAKRLVTKIP